MKSRMLSGIVVCVAIVSGAIILQARNAERSAQGPGVTSANAPAELSAALGEIVKIHERQLASVEAEYKAGQAGFAKVIDVKIGILKARNRLAQSRGESAKVIEGLRTILVLRENILDEIQTNYRGGRTNSDTLFAARLDVLEAKVELCEAVMRKTQMRSL